MILGARLRHWLAARSAERNSGHVAVEYALTLPYLLAFIYGIVEISHFAYLRTTVANVARDAVRYAVVHSSISAQPATAATVTTYVNNELSSLGLSQSGTGGTSVTVTYSPDNTPGSTVNVKISYPFAPFMPGFNAVPGSSTSFATLVGPILGSSQMVVNP
jgi:Flp pilus assembly protein TadG